MSFFDCGGVRLLLGTAERPDANFHSSIIYFRVQDIQSAHAALASHGVEIVQPPNMIAKMPDHDLWLAEFCDSEGNVHVLMSEVPRAA